jgi:hypothetical protein
MPQIAGGKRRGRDSRCTRRLFTRRSGGFRRKAKSAPERNSLRERSLFAKSAQVVVEQAVSEFEVL